MNSEQGVQFLQALGAKQIRVKDNGWIEAACPLARWTHKHQQDLKPSFGLSVTPGGRSYFQCFACRQGSAEELLHTLELYASKSEHTYDFARCHQILADEEVVMPLPDFQEFPPTEQVFGEWPVWWLDSFQHAGWVLEATKYLLGRGVSVTEQAQFNLRYDPKRQMIVAPYWDVFNRLAGARGRAIHEQKHYDYTFQGVNNAKLVWYHEPVLNLPGPVVVVEGQFDLWKTVQAYPKTIAALTAKPTWPKMKKLADCGLVIQIPDRDEAGYQSTIRYAQMCQQLGLDHRVVWLDEGVKDPGDCSVEYLKDKIQEVIE